MLRSGTDLKIGIDFSVTIDRQLERTLEAHLISGSVVALDSHAPGIEQLCGKYRADDETLAVLDQFAQEPEMHRRQSEYYAYEFFVARLMG